jgi:hypothetical protein
MAKLPGYSDIVKKGAAQNHVQAASPDLGNTGPRESFGSSGTLIAGGHQPVDNVHAQDHRGMMAAQPGQTTPILNTEYNRILAQANAGCPTCQAFVAGVRRAGRSQSYLKQQAAAQPGANSNTSAIGPVPRMAQPSTYQAMAGAEVSRTVGRAPYKAVVTGTSIRAARAQAADQLRARRLAGQHAVVHLTRDPGESFADFIVRQQVVRGHAEIAYDRMLSGKR